MPLLIQLGATHTWGTPLQIPLLIHPALALLNTVSLVWKCNYLGRGAKYIALKPIAKLLAGGKIAILQYNRDS
jgi:hypothetical protein